MVLDFSHLKSLKTLIAPSRAVSYRRQALMTRREGQAVVAGGANGREVDEFIRAVVQRQRTPTPQDAQQLRDHLASAPFSTQRVRAGSDVEGLTYFGRTVKRQDESWFVHLVKRVEHDRQWADGTTIDQYLAGLHQFIRDEGTDILVYARHGRPVAAAFGQNTVPPTWRGTAAEPYLFVVYAVEQRAIITGYQVGSLDAVRIPDDAIWLT